MNKPNAYPIHKKFLVTPDEGEDRTDAGIFLTEKTPKFTGTVVRLPSQVVAIDTTDETEYDKETQVKDFAPGRLIKIGTRIQWSSQSGFAIPVNVEEEDYLLFTIHDVDIILPDG